MATEMFENRWLERGYKFLRTLSRNGIVRGALLDRGLTEEELQRGWDLFATASGFTRNPHLAGPELSAGEALQRLEAWDAPNYAATHATLENRTPAAHAYLMLGLVAGAGPDAVVGVRNFVDRAIALREGTVAGVSAAEGAEAVRLLAQRKIFNEAIERQLREWIARTQQGAAPQTKASPDDEASFVQYRNWVHEWREIARATITQRSYLIALGLAERRNGDPEEPAAQVATAPAVEAAPVSVH